MDRYLKYIIIGALIIGGLLLVSCNQKSGGGNSQTAIIIDELGQAISKKGRDLYLLKEPNSDYKPGDVIEVMEIAGDGTITGGEVTKNITRNIMDINLVADVLEKNPEIILIDVRTIEEYNSGHLDGAINYPVENMNGNSNLAWDKDKTLIVYCRSGNRSATAANILNKLGYVFVLDAGGVNSFNGELVK